MPQPVFSPPPVPMLPIVNDDAVFPVGRIFCVGRNYADHAAEMGHAVDREAPFYFTKSAHAVLLSGHDMAYPPRTNDLHHEVELVVALASGGRDIAIADAMACVFGYACGLDMTRRDLQAQAKDKRRPWDTGKDFDQAAIIAPLTRAEAVGDITQAQIALHVNGELRQQGRIADMVWSIPEIISDLSSLYTLQAGDVIMTGTPAGVAAVVAGDHLQGTVTGLAPLATRISAG